MKGATHSICCFVIEFLSLHSKKSSVVVQPSPHMFHPIMMISFDGVFFISPCQKKKKIVERLYSAHKRSVHTREEARERIAKSMRTYTYMIVAAPFAHS